VSRAPRSAWILNFDAGDELARGAGYTARRDVLARGPALATRVGPLVPPGDVVVGPPPLGDGAPRALAGLLGRSFCPTPSALALLRRLGCASAPGPPFDVLRLVNHRAFHAALGLVLPGARFALSIDDVDSTLAAHAPASGAWLLKRPFGYAGRGRRRVTAPLDPAARAWVEASLRGGGGLAVEPFVAITQDLALHGHVSRAGRIALGAPTRQRCDASGAWVATEPAGPGDLEPGERTALIDSAREAGEALGAAGYFGPFGVDAYRYEEHGRAIFHPRSEINARYSMGWAVGMGALRPDLDDEP
jgi:hypothetical protein